MLSALGIEPEVCHLNEGHAALAVIERARALMRSKNQPFNIALAATRAGNIFTTHTPVEAGFDIFTPEMIGYYLGDYADKTGIGLDGLLALGRQEPSNKKEFFNMAYLALRGSGNVNGVSRSHGEVSRRIFQPLFPRWPQWEVPITYVTNGVHTPSWDSQAADKLWSDACGKGRWIGTMDTIMDDLKKLPDEVIWNFRMAESKQLIQYVRERLARQLASSGVPADITNQVKQWLDENVLTIGFARRFAEYKRPNLLLHDRERLARILSNPRQPVQLIIAGKAHPQDEEGKAMIQEWSEFINRPDVRHHAVFLADYDMGIAERLVQGVDLWVNTPRRPWEACGTSGMKVLVNGGLNLSVRDGWWAEAYQPNLGWAIGDGWEHSDTPGLDAQEAEQLYRVLEEEIVPCFYKRDANGVPQDWVARMRLSMAELTPRFSTNRMLREYVEELYLPAVEKYRRRIARGYYQSIGICRWYELIQKYWSQLSFGKLETREENGGYNFEVMIHIGDLDPSAVSVQLCAEPLNNQEPEIHPMQRGNAIALPFKGYVYKARILAKRPINDYTPRIIPFFEGAQVPLEARQILWYR
jgi:starch phosphorylase